MTDPERDDEEERNARAASLLDEAQQAALEHGRAVVAEARAVRRRMLEDVEQRRQDFVAELEHLRAAIDETITALRSEASDEVRADLPARPSEALSPAPERIQRAAAVFDALRAEPPKPEPPARPKKPARTKKEAPAGPSEPSTSSESAPAAVAEPPASEGTGSTPSEPAANGGPERGGPGAAVVRQRDSLLEPLLPDVLRSSKRLLQDEQNSLLDAVRRARGKHEPGRLLPDPLRQREAWTALLGRAFNAAYLGGRAAAGKTGRVTSAPDRVVIELTAALVTPLRERIATTIDAVVSEGPYESQSELHRALGTAIGARYREWRTVDLEVRVFDVLCAAYARGAYEASAPAAMLQWLPDEPGRCPDCDDNSLEVTLKGKPFPTGQTHPPAHPGCRCVAVPADAAS